ncbi:MAG: hypothetical protein Q8R35_00860 [bacterium]|nr:hypothetical protein [bacterium]
MIKAVFFDVGGVLVRLIGRRPRFEAARLLGVSRNELLPIFRSRMRQIMEGKLSEHAFWNLIGREYQSSGREVRQLMEIFSHRKPHLKIRVRAIATRLRQNGYMVGILSDVIPSHVKQNRRFGIYRGFHPVLLSCVIGAVKRRKMAFRVAARRANVKFSEMAFVDDRRENVAIAKKLGIHAFVYKNSAQLGRALRRLGVKV